MKRLAVVVFILAFLGYVWLEFVSDQPTERIKDILFWIGMGGVLAVQGWDGRGTLSR